MSENIPVTPSEGWRLFARAEDHHLCALNAAGEVVDVTAMLTLRDTLLAMVEDMRNRSWGSTPGEAWLSEYADKIEALIRES